MIKAILLDLDGTLIDRAALWSRCVRHYLAGRGFPFAEDQLAWTWRDWHDWSGVAQMLHLELPELGDRRVLARGLRDQMLRSAVPDPAVNALVDALGRRYRTAIVTNGSARLQRAKIVGAGLAGRTGAEFISGRMGVRKPDPEFFRRVLAWAGVEPAEALIVGDHPHDDIRGGQMAGLQTCLVVPDDCPDVWTRSDYRIARFVDLPGVLG